MSKSAPKRHKGCSSVPKGHLIAEPPTLATLAAKYGKSELNLTEEDIQEIAAAVALQSVLP